LGRHFVGGQILPLFHVCDEAVAILTFCICNEQICSEGSCWGKRIWYKAVSVIYSWISKRTVSDFSLFILQANKSRILHEFKRKLFLSGARGLQMESGCPCLRSHRMNKAYNTLWLNMFINFTTWEVLTLGSVKEICICIFFPQLLVNDTQSAISSLEVIFSKLCGLH
jgi:hypothetical protein